MYDDIEKFVNKILSINAPVINMFGHGVTGMGGGAAIEQSEGTSGNDITRQLKNTAIQFLKLIYRNKSITEEILDCVKKLEGLLRTEQVISVLSQKQSDQLINEMYELVDKYQIQTSS